MSIVKDIFLSYAREDEIRVKQLGLALEKAGGWSIFWDRNVPYGQTWRDYIGKALSGAKCIIVAWSHSSITSRWVIEEAEEGIRRKILLPVLLDSVEPPFGFRDVQAANLINWPTNAHPDEQIGRIADTVRAIIQDCSALQSEQTTANKEFHHVLHITKSRWFSPQRTLILVGAIILILTAFYILRSVRVEQLHSEKQQQFPTPAIVPPEPEKFQTYPLAPRTEEPCPEVAITDTTKYPPVSRKERRC